MNKKREKKTRVLHQETPRDYSTEIPNIVDFMHKEEIISKSDFIFYLILKNITGENGVCCMGTRMLAKVCRLSKDTITKSKKNLSRGFKILNGKSLIKVQSNDAVNMPDTITTTDIWAENSQFSKIY